MITEQCSYRNTRSEFDPILQRCSIVWLRFPITMTLACIDSALWIICSAGWPTIISIPRSMPFYLARSRIETKLRSNSRKVIHCVLPSRPGAKHDTKDQLGDSANDDFGKRRRNFEPDGQQRGDQRQPHPQCRKGPCIRHGCTLLKICTRGSRRDMTPQQDSLSGVIICPAWHRGQRLTAFFQFTWSLGHCARWRFLKGKRHLSASIKPNTNWKNAIG